MGAVAAGRLLTGCAGGAGGDGSTTSSPVTQPVPSGPSTLATVSISSTQAGTIPAGFFGLSYEKSDLSTPIFSGSNTNLIGLFQRLGPSLLRIGGGSVDGTNWNPSGPGQTSGETAPADVNALAAFASAANWRVLYGVNLATSTPQTAAAEVAYAAQELGGNLLGIEIGNEPDIYVQEGLFPSTWGLSDYLALWQSFASAIVAQTPKVALTGPATILNSGWFGSFAQAEGSSVTLLTAHYYLGDGLDPSSTIQDMLTYPDTNLQSYLSTLNSAAVNAGLPFRMAETNSFYNGGAPGVSDAFASALWVLDEMFTIAQSGGVGANYHTVGTSSQNGPGASYSVIATNNGVVVDAQPEYYAGLVLTLAGQGALLSTSISAGSLNTSAYTVQNSSTQLSVILVNKDQTQNLQFTATCPSKVQSALMQVLTAPSLSALSGVTIQGASVGNNGSFSPQAPYSLNVSGSTFSGYVPAASACLVQVTLASA